MSPLTKIHDILSRIMKLKLQFFCDKLKIFFSQVSELRFKELDFSEHWHDQVKNIMVRSVVRLFLQSLNQLNNPLRNNFFGLKFQILGKGPIFEFDLFFLAKNILLLD